MNKTFKRRRDAAAVGEAGKVGVVAPGKAGQNQGGHLVVPGGHHLCPGAVAAANVSKLVIAHAHSLFNPI